MSVNKVKILLPDTNKYVNVPVELNWDFTGRDDSIEEYQRKMVKEVIGIANDFETLRFAHNQFLNQSTEINYEFSFFDNSQPITATTLNPGNWDITYQNQGFLPTDIYYFVKPFTKSFFKLDFYDTPEDKTQTLYFSIILPVQQGLTESASINIILPNVDIKKPKFILDYIGDKEGFFIYWLRKRDFINLDEFYMSAKFFNGRTGLYVTMTNTPQPLITPSRFNFLGNDYFYYKVNLDYTTNTYEVLQTSTNARVGDSLNPIKWYEYVNP
jgi:hypothetical protein